MTTPTPRQAALERLATALKDRWYQIADTEVIDNHLSRAWDQLADAALTAVEQAAPCSECEEYGEPCWRHTPPSGQPAPEKDFIRGYQELGLDLEAHVLADARAAIRAASPLLRHGALFTHASVSQEAACPACQWLALPAVRAAREEEKQ